MTDRVERYELGEPWPLEALEAIGAGRAELHFGARALARVLVPTLALLPVQHWQHRWHNRDRWRWRPRGPK